MQNDDFKEMFAQDLDLCNAVVLNAVDDWREGMKYLYLHPNGQKKNIKFMKCVTRNILFCQMILQISPHWTAVILCECLKKNLKNGRKNKMLNFILGFLIGGLVGALTMIFARAAKMADEEMPKVPNDTEQRKTE